LVAFVSCTMSYCWSGLLSIFYVFLFSL